jgi:hypothetical protein
VPLLGWFFFFNGISSKAGTKCSLLAKRTYIYKNEYACSYQLSRGLDVVYVYGVTLLLTRRVVLLMLTKLVCGQQHRISSSSSNSNNN